MATQPAPARPAVEWIFGIASAILVAALALFLAYEALFSPAGPPQLSATVESIEHLAGATVVNVAVFNRGGETASAVTVAAAAEGNGASPKEIQFDYVAPGAVRRGAFVFAGQAGPVRIEVQGFTDP